MDSSESTATLLLVISELLKEGQVDKGERDKLKSFNLHLLRLACWKSFSYAIPRQ